MELEDSKHLPPKFSYALSNISTMFGFPLQYDNGCNADLNTASSQKLETDCLQDIQNNAYSRQSKAKHLTSQMQEFTNTVISNKMKANTPEPQNNRNEIVKIKLQRLLNNSNSGVNEVDQNNDNESNLKKLLCMLNRHSNKAEKPSIPKIMYSINKCI